MLSIRFNVTEPLMLAPIETFRLPLTAADVIADWDCAAMLIPPSVVETVELST